ncbi:M20/M25/M40 family metallo-hydrolase [Halobacillus faecis]|uniref:Protein RocB n=1 Tax=Halobacillus faecis TaxID=360184 RepID=A0A511WTQ9_9BACI|nr:M20/M25/M40 family metallo-hydrolase [Halobacillus faecis]GEN54525.1 protein RocB [Halobacillus faecis]
MTLSSQADALQPRSPETLYAEIRDLKDEDKIERLTKALVHIPSINGTSGEVTIAEYLEAFIRTIPYFKDHPEAVWTQPLKNDFLGRKNVYAIIRNQKHADTVLYHSHMDTVGIDDFGKLKGLAYHPHQLREHFAKHGPTPEIRSHARSEDWMFGRGSVDMKSGIAVHLVNLIHFSKRSEELEGNVLLMLNPIEENEHTGVIDSVEELQRLQKEWGLDLKVAINNDFVTELYPGDPNYYIYTGAIGKLLPCFSIFGREAHVGETLTGVDPTLISAEINRRINNNMELSERINGEHMLPPTCLQQRDQKDFYNVQTPLNSRLYFNYFIYESSPDEVMEKLVSKTTEACASTQAHMEKQYRTFLRTGNYPDQESLHWDVSIYTYEEYVRHLETEGIDVRTFIEELEYSQEEMDKREIAFHVVESLQSVDPDKQPKVVIFFAPPYCPHNFLREEVESEKRIIDVLQEVTSQNKDQVEGTFAVKKFFPFLSDSSYLSLHDSEEEVQALIDNFPEYHEIYPVPIQEIRKLNIPSINMGVYGKDAHKYTERVYKPYTFTTLPQLTRQVTEKIFQN